MKKTSRVIIIGVDGAGTFFRQANTPNIDRIFADGAVSYDVLTSNPTVSGQCWGSMLTGVTPDIHGLTNGRAGSTPYPTDSIFPTMFRVIRENMPDAELASFCNWGSINIGIVEEGLGVTKGTGSDESIADQVCSYVAEHDPALMFIQLDEVDGAGHAHGYGTENHLKQIEASDTLIGKIWDAYNARGWLDDTLFIVTADHGGRGHDHGGWTDGEKYIMFAAIGPNVVKGTIGEMGVRDTTSIVLHALGLAGKQPETWTSRVPSGLFEGVVAGERPIYEIKYAHSFRLREPGVTPTGDKSLAALLGRDRITAYFPFDGSSADENGGLVPEEHGKFYYINGYNDRGIRVEDGYMKLPWTPGKKSFSIALWVKSDGVKSDPAIIADKEWASGYNPGFIIALDSGAVLQFNYGNREDRIDAAFGLPIDYSGGWVHAVMVIDREAMEVRCAFDFGKFNRVVIPEKFRDESFGRFDYVYFGQEATLKYAPLTAVLDDFVLVDGILTEEDVAKMKEFYGA